MEITISKKNVMIGVFAVFLLAVAAYFAPQAIDAVLESQWFAEPVPVMDYDNQPAFSALETMFATGITDRAAWESAVCADMTVDGCQVFKAVYAGTIWKMEKAGANASFSQIVDKFEDGSQIWRTDVTLGADAPKPIYIHVEKNESGEWLLVRVLFAEEAKRYEQ